MRESERPLQQHVFPPELPVLDLLAHFHLEQVECRTLAQVVARAEALASTAVSVDAKP